MEPSTRTSPHRHAERVSHEDALIHAILDEAVVAHIGFDNDGPLVLPVVAVRIGEHLYVHLSTGSGAALRAPMEVCVTATILDGAVLAKSWFHHSLNARSVVVRGRAELVTDTAETLRALAATIDRVAPGRSSASRPPSARELAATAILRIPLAESSAKVRTGPPVEDEADLDLPFWSGVVPLRIVAGQAQPGPGVEAPAPATAWSVP